MDNYSIDRLLLSVKEGKKCWKLRQT